MHCTSCTCNGRQKQIKAFIYKGFKYEETGVEGAEFEVYAKDTIYSPDGAKDEAGNPVVRYEKDDLVAKLTTDENGTAVINNLPLGTYYLKEVVAGENFVLNTEQKEFTLTAEDDTQAVVYEGVTYKNERQKVFVSVERKILSQAKSWKVLFLDCMLQKIFFLIRERFS